MTPVGQLMIEHRLIERMIKIFGTRVNELEGQKELDLDFVDEAVDFICTYADRCHHGKEEDILFRALSKKDLPPELAEIQQQLLAEHQSARQMVSSLVEGERRCLNGDIQGLHNMIRWGNELVSFYPSHIEKEDKHFFFPCQKLFNGEELQAMMQEFAEFDRQLIHEKYGELVEKMENNY